VHSLKSESPGFVAVKEMSKLDITVIGDPDIFLPAPLELYGKLK
jgi:hypothetical protein